MLQELPNAFLGLDLHKNSDCRPRLVESIHLERPQDPMVQVLTVGWCPKSVPDGHQDAVRINPPRFVMQAIFVQVPFYSLSKLLGHPSVHIGAGLRGLELAQDRRHAERMRRN